jgi:hypothetical protein
LLDTGNRNYCRLFKEFLGASTSSRKTLIRTTLSKMECNDFFCIVVATAFYFSVIQLTIVLMNVDCHFAECHSVDSHFVDNDFT